ncbi:hypothetical protein UY3_04180 [Chelonia mydas]|uniref:Uncharacterized protein n=1 Tax=Chelonia mydas TaxID=8469 RepID=M7BN02_CHEMY|nr:hypothetical protein UY3_04180 [Chelonia mydas]
MQQASAKKLSGLHTARAKHRDYTEGSQSTTGTKGNDMPQPGEELPEAEKGCIGKLPKERKKLLLLKCIAHKFENLPKLAYRELYLQHCTTGPFLEKKKLHF